MNYRETMTVGPRPHWLHRLLVWRRPIFPKIVPQLLWTTAFAVLVTVLHGHLIQWKGALNLVPFLLIGLTPVILLSLWGRTSDARHWEAHTLWRTVIDDTLSLIRQLSTMTNDSVTSGLPTARAIAFVHTLRHQLRGTDSSEDIARLLPLEDCARLQAARFKPAVLLLMIGEWVRSLRRSGHCDLALVQAVEVWLARLTEALGACERIAGTPPLFAYSVITHRTIYLYCAILPFGLVDALGAMTPVAVSFIAYAFFALETLCAEIEEPFVTRQDDIALEAMSHAFEASVREMQDKTRPQL